MSKIKHTKLNYALGCGSLCGFLALAFFIISPPVTSGVQAESTAMHVPIEVQAGRMLSLALDDSQAIMAVQPTKEGAFSSQNLNLKVETNAVDGYKIYVNAAGDDTALSKVSSGASGKITSINNTVTTANFPKDQWGYSLVEGKATPTEYRPILSASSTGVPVETKNAKQQDYTLSFATKVSTDLPAGTYRNTMVISAVTNPEVITGLDQLVYMQDMTNDICKNTVGTDGQPVAASLHNEPSKQLIDIRDGNSYWVSKLADGNCWMVQNLALNLDPSRPLTPNDSDVAASWTPGNKTEISVPARVEGGGPSNDTRSWNLGKYVLKDPASTVACDNITTSGNITACNRLEAWNGTQDAHYLIGNYYQWNAAVAGSGADITNARTRDSICPKGWELPSADGGIARNATEVAAIVDYDTKYGKTFTKLFTSYGYSFPDGKAPDISGSNKLGSYDVALEPFYYARGGNIDLDLGSTSVVGMYGSYWSSMTPASAHSAYHSYLSTNSVGPSTLFPRYGGFFVRCVAR